MLKVMSFNIRYGLADDGVNCWDNRKFLVVSRIRALYPDLLGIQECLDPVQASFLKQQLPEYHFYGVPRGIRGEPIREMAPILYKKSVFHALRKNCFWLSETPWIAGSKSWDSAFPRTVSWVELQHRVTGRSVFFINTHFDYQPLAIDASAKLLRRFIKPLARRYPLVITGDFNVAKDSVAYRCLTNNSLLVDTCRQVHPLRADSATFHDYGKNNEADAIDWILTSPLLTTRAADIDDYHEDSLYPSDHYPLIALLDWSRILQKPFGHFLAP